MSMYIRFLLRGPKHETLTEGRFDYVPRLGESVSYNDRTRDVHSIDYNISNNSMTIVLRD